MLSGDGAQPFPVPKPVPGVSFVGLPLLRCKLSPAQVGPPPALPPCLTTGLEFDRWLNTPGWPPFLPDLSPGQQLMKPADELAELWAADSLNVEAIEAVDITAWKTYQLVYFLDQLLQKSPLPEGEGLAPRGSPGWHHTGPRLLAGDVGAPPGRVGAHQLGTSPGDTRVVAAQSPAVPRLARPWCHHLRSPLLAPGAE